MRILLQLISFLLLTGLIGGAVLFFQEESDLEQTKAATLVLTLGWFIVTPLWMGRKASTKTEQRGQS